MKNALQAVIFDMDGTLVDSEPLNDDFYKRHLEKNYGVSPTLEFFERTRGLNGKTFWEMIIKEFGVEQTIEELKLLARKEFKEELEMLEEIEPIVGLRQLLIRLNEAYITLALASSASPGRIKTMLRLLKLENIFSAVVSGDDIEHGKPAPDIYLKAAEQLDVNPQNCVAIEDATSGVASARAAGMKVIGFAGLPHNKQDLSEADIIVKHFDEVTIELLNRL